jgi:hypothetical protein
MASDNSSLDEKLLLRTHTVVLLILTPHIPGTKIRILTTVETSNITPCFEPLFQYNIKYKKKVILYNVIRFAILDLYL